MYLHLGQDVIVKDTDVVGICDLDITSQSYLTREFLRKAEQDGRIVNVSDEIPKSFVICGDKEHSTVYISQLNSATLLRRWESGADELTRE